MKTALAILTGRNHRLHHLEPGAGGCLQNTLSELASENVSLVDLLNSTQNLHDQSADPSFQTLLPQGDTTSAPGSSCTRADSSPTRVPQPPLSYTKETDHALAKWVQEQQATVRNPNFNASVGWVTFLLRHNLDLSVNKKMKPHRKLKVADFSGSDNDSDDVSPPGRGRCGWVEVEWAEESDPASVRVLHLQPGPGMVSDRTHDGATRSTLKISGISSVTTEARDECGGRSAGREEQEQCPQPTHPRREVGGGEADEGVQRAGHYVCRMLGIANSTIAGWIKLVQQKGPELEALSVNKKRANVSGQGRPLSYSRSKDDAIAQWVLAQQDQGAQVTSTDLAKYATNLIGQENANFTAFDWASGDRVPLVEDQQSIPTPVQTEEVITHESVEKPYSEEMEEQFDRVGAQQGSRVRKHRWCRRCASTSKTSTATSNPSFVATWGGAFRFLHRNKLLLDPKPPPRTWTGGLVLPSRDTGLDEETHPREPRVLDPEEAAHQLEQAMTMSPSTAGPGGRSSMLAAAQQTQPMEEEGVVDLQSNPSTYFGKPAREFTPEEKEEVVRYANATTLQKAASRYEVAAPTGVALEGGAETPPAQGTPPCRRRYIIKFAENNSLKEAGRQRFGITTKTIQNWRKAPPRRGADERRRCQRIQELQEGMDAADISGGSDMVNYDGQNFNSIVDGGEVVDGNTRCAGEQGGEGSVRAGLCAAGGDQRSGHRDVGMEYDIVSSEGHSAKPPLHPAGEDADTTVRPRPLHQGGISKAVTNLLSNVDTANEKHKLSFYKLAAAVSRELASPTDVLIPFSDQPTSDAEQTVLTEAHSAVTRAAGSDQ
eukprot:Em0015g274a